MTPAQAHLLDHLQNLVAELTARVEALEAQIKKEKVTT